MCVRGFAAEARADSVTDHAADSQSSMSSAARPCARPAAALPLQAQVPNKSPSTRATRQGNSCQPSHLLHTGNAANRQDCMRMHCWRDDAADGGARLTCHGPPDPPPGSAPRPALRLQPPPRPHPHHHLRPVRLLLLRLCRRPATAPPRWTPTRSRRRRRPPRQRRAPLTWRTTPSRSARARRAPWSRWRPARSRPASPPRLQPQIMQGFLQGLRSSRLRQAREWCNVDLAIMTTGEPI